MIPTELECVLRLEENVINEENLINISNEEKQHKNITTLLSEKK